MHLNSSDEPRLYEPRAEKKSSDSFRLILKRSGRQEGAEGGQLERQVQIVFENCAASQSSSTVQNGLFGLPAIR